MGGERARSERGKERGREGEERKVEVEGKR